jgi:energy-coupling factor transporter ATP-binding protein EcfA2
MSPGDSSLATHLSTIATQYPSPGDGNATDGAPSVGDYPEIQDLFRQAAQAIDEQVTAQLGDQWVVEYGFGQGSMAHIPHIAVMRKDVTESVHRGVYVVYLFDPIENQVYLTLNQGAAELNRLAQSTDIDEKAAELLKKQADYYRGMPDSSDYGSMSGPWKAGSASLSGSLRRAKNYNNGTILHTDYTAESIDEREVVNELLGLVSIYDSFLDLTFEQLQFELENKRAFKIGIPSTEEWGRWVDGSYINTSGGGGSNSEIQINPGDIIVAGRTDNLTDYVVGFGVVRETSEEELRTRIQDQSELASIDIDTNNVYSVDWEPLYEGGIPVSVPRSESKLFNESRATSIDGTLLNRLVSGVGHRIGAIENKSTKGLSKSLFENRTLADALQYVDFDSSVTRGEDDPELHPYWQGVKTKRTFAEDFLARPTKDQFHRLVDPDHFRATNAFGSLEYYVEDVVFADQSPEEVAAALRNAVESGLQNDGSLQGVLELDGFGWAVATEALHAIAPADFAILNSRSVTALSALEFDTPNPASATVEEYRQFVANIQTAIQKHEIPTRIPEFTDERIPEWATGLELAERAFRLHVTEGMGLSPQTTVSEQEAIIDTWSPPSDVFGEQKDTVSLSEIYFPPDGANQSSLPIQIDTALRSGKHIILTGPPGSGKTELAKRICQHYRNQQYALVTATDDWSTFDTIGGYHPDRDKSLQFKPGVFLTRFLEPSQPPKAKNEWLIIDEINRADIDKAFGSLFSALTGNNVSLPFENSEGQIELIGDPEARVFRPLTTHHYYIPSDWRIIATMNTDDKSSLYRMSYAFMRRFAHISVPVPSAEQIDAELLQEYCAPSRWDLSVPDDSPLDSEILFRDVATIWQAIQRRKQIGPALIKDLLEHLLTQEATDEGEYAEAMAIYILPQLEGLREKDMKRIISEISNRIAGFDRGVAVDFANTSLDMNLEYE